MLNVSERPLSIGSSMPSKRLLGAWLGPTLNWTDGKVQVKQRGNVLHILCESAICPDRSILTQRLRNGIAGNDFWPQLLPDGARVHRFVLYGRVMGDAKPSWGETFELAIDESLELERSEEPIPSSENPPSENAPIAQPTVPKNPGLPHASSSPTDLASAARGDMAASLRNQFNSTPEKSPTPLKSSSSAKRKQLSNEGIAHHLSRQLSPYNIAVRVKRRALNDRPTFQRLFVVCESIYSPDPNVIAEPIAQCLRELALRDCRDAFISGQVKGETEPDWVVRVDLTPADQMLRSRAQWGDWFALERLLLPLTRECCQSVRVSLEQSTLHIVFYHDRTSVPQNAVVRVVSEFLQELSPQGIQSARLYGVLKNPNQETTQWVQSITLPGEDQAEFAPTPADLVRRGNLTAIGQFLTRQLNPDLTQQLATGGIRVQVRQRESILHVMTDALKVPQKDQVLEQIQQTLLPLGLEGVTGLCVYGRRAGQQKPHWQQSFEVAPTVHDRHGRHPRLVPESVPEFTASDSYVEDLLAPPGEIVFVPRKADRHWGETVEKLRNGTRSILLKTPFFAPISLNQRMITRQEGGLDGRVAVVWGLLGLSLMVTGDWAIGLVLRSQGLGHFAEQDAGSTTQPAVKSETTSLSSIALNRSTSSDLGAFNASEFTKHHSSPNHSNPKAGKPNSGLKTLPTQVPLAAVKSTPLIDPGLDANLPSSPLQPKAAVDPARSPYPSLNSPQLDERLALYQQYVSVYGVPDVLVVGSSRALRGVDPAALQEMLTQQGFGGKRVFNFGVNGATAQVVDLILRRLIAPDQLPKIILWADGARAFNSGRVDVTYNAIAASPGYRKLPAQPVSPQAQQNSSTPAPEPAPQSLPDRYRALEETLQNWLNGVSVGGQNRDVMIGLARERFLGNPIAKPKSEDEVNLSSGAGLTDVNGFLSLSNQFNPATYYQKYSKVSGAFDSDYDAFQLQGRQQEALKAIAGFTQAQNIALVFVNLPMTMEYLDPRRSDYENDFQRSMVQASDDLKFTYRDLSKFLEQQNALFSDPSHLNRYGAYAVSQQLAKDTFMPWKKSKP